METAVRTTSKRKAFQPMRAMPRAGTSAPLRIVTLQSLLSAGLPAITNDRASSFQRSAEPRIRQSLTPNLDEQATLPDVPLVVVSQPVTTGRRGRGGKTNASPRNKRAASLDFEGVTTKRRRGPPSDMGESDAGNGPRSPMSSGFPDAPPVAPAGARGRARGKGRRGAGARSISSRVATPQLEDTSQDPSWPSKEGTPVPPEVPRVSRTSTRPTHLVDYDTPQEAIPT